MSNRITVGKTYVYSIAKEYIKYLHMNNDSELEKQQKYYKGKELAGKISFLRNIEGETGYRMLVERIRISTKGIVCITEDKIQFE